MLKTKLVYLLIILTSFCHKAFTQEVNYYNGNNQYVFDSILYSASVEKKPVFIFIHSDYCGVCSDLETQTLNDSGLVKVLNNNYYSIKTGLESEAGAKQVNLFKVANIPTLLILNWKGQQLRKITGLMDANDLTRMLLRIAEWRDKYIELSAKCIDLTCTKSETAQQIIIMAYLQLYNEGLPLAKKYFKKYGYKELFEDEWEIMTEYFYDPADSPLLYFIDHVPVFRENYGDKNVDNYLQKLFEYNFDVAVKNKNLQRLEFSLNLLDHFKAGTGEPMLMPRMRDYYTLRYYNKTENWQEYSKLAFDYFQKYENEEEETREILMNIYLNSVDMRDIKKSLSFAKELVKNNPSFENKITLAFFEQRLGKYSVAYKLLDEAERLAGSQDELNTLKKIREKFIEMEKGN